MKVLNGIDIVEISRIRDSIEKYGDKFLNRVYTENEIRYCESKKNQKYESYAARFAAKEAVYKAISTRINNLHEWKEIEVLKDENGKPKVSLKKDVEGIDYIEISLSHSKEYAVASAIAVYKEK